MCPQQTDACTDVLSVHRRRFTAHISNSSRVDESANVGVGPRLDATGDALVADDDDDDDAGVETEVSK